MTATANNSIQSLRCFACAAGVPIGENEMKDENDKKRLKQFRITFIKIMQNQALIAVKVCIIILSGFQSIAAVFLLVRLPKD